MGYIASLPLIGILCILVSASLSEVSDVKNNYLQVFVTSPDATTGVVFVRGKEGANVKIDNHQSQSAGFEPARAEPNRFRVYRLNHSAMTAPMKHMLIGQLVKLHYSESPLAVRGCGLFCVDTSVTSSSFSASPTG